MEGPSAHAEAVWAHVLPVCSHSHLAKGSRVPATYPWCHVGEQELERVVDELEEPVQDRVIHVLHVVQPRPGRAVSLE